MLSKAEVQVIRDRPEQDTDIRLLVQSYMAAMDKLNFWSGVMRDDTEVQKMLAAYHGRTEGQ